MVAVVIPCHNSAKTLTATLNSVVNQNRADEIIVIDDGSHDQTVALARTFGPRVSVLTGSNEGVSAARNRGINETSSEWLLFLDSDDLLLPGTIDQRMATLREVNADVVVCDWEELVDNDGGEVMVSGRRCIDWLGLVRDAELATATNVWATTAALLYRRGLVERIGGFRSDLRVIQDARLLFDAARYGARFAYSRHVGARYRVAQGSLSRRDPVRFWQDVLLNGRQIEELWRGNGILGEARLAGLAGIYNHAARGLFAAAHPSYFEAVAGQHRLGLPLPRHTRLAAPLAQIVGLRAARSVLSLIS